MSEKEKVEHVGTKTLTLFFGMLLSFIYALLKFFNSNFNLTLNDLANIGLVTAFFSLVFVAIIFFAQLFWKYAHALSEKIGKP